MIWFDYFIILAGVAAIQFLLSLWIKKRIEASIQHEYDTKLEEYRFSQLQRQKAELVARLFARWIKYRGKEKDLLNQHELIEYYESLNQMSLEIALWIKDVPLLNNIMARLEMKAGAKTINELTGDIRALILGAKDDFDSQKIVLWPKSEELPNVFVKE